MHILHLSEDILISIFEYLDLESKLTLYNVCESFRAILLSKYLALRSYKLSFCNKRWSSILSHPYFSASNEYLVELDVSGLTVHKYTKYKKCDELRTELKSAIKMMSNLEDLNIGFTELTMPDCSEMCPHLPKLVKLCVNFIWPYKPVDFTDDMLLSYREAFRNVQYLHFIGYQKLLLDTDVLLYMSVLDKPKELRLTFINKNDNIYNCKLMSDTRKFDEISMNCDDIFPYKKLTFDNLTNLGFNLNSKLMRYTQLSFEKILIHVRNNMNNFDPEIYVTPRLLPDVKEGDCVTQLSVITDSMPDYFKYNTCKIVMWHKNHNAEKMYNEVRDYLSSALPVQVTESNVDAMKSYRGSIDTFSICYCAFETNHISDIGQIFPDTTRLKKLKLGNSDLCHSECAHLPNVRFDGNLYVLTNLRYLSLLNEVEYLDVMLSDVISCCPRLETIVTFGSIDEQKIKKDFVKYSNTLKHICLFLTRIDVNVIISALSLCPTLENIVLNYLSTSRVTKQSVSNVIENFPKLSYLAIPAIPFLKKRRKTKSYSPHVFDYLNNDYEYNTNDSDNNLQRQILHEVHKHRHKFEYRLIDSHYDNNLNLPRERVFLLHNFPAPENIC